MLETSVFSPGISRPAAGLSLLAHAVLLLLLVMLPVPLPAPEAPRSWKEPVTLVAPGPAVYTRPRQQRALAAPVERPLLQFAYSPRKPAPAEPVVPSEWTVTEAPAIIPTTQPATSQLVAVAPLPSRAPVRAQVFDGIVVAAATVPSSPISIRAGGFGALASATPARLPVGLPARVGSFETAAAAGSPGEVPQRLAVHSSGFSDAGAPAIAPTRPASRLHSSDGTGVEILFKPQPAYSDEARRLRIEGSVLLEVVFDRSGRVEVLRVVKGLGHGLDEKAAEAARQIRFKPARADGQPVDLNATIRISFELAF